MSQYTTFFIRGKDDYFYPLSSYSRNNFINRFIDAPYSKIKAVSYKDLKDANTEIDKNLKELEDTINDIQAKKADLKSLTISSIETLNDVTDKLNTFDENLQELRDEITDLIWLQGQLSVFHSILDEAKYNDKDLDETRYLYVGIEAGKPTLEDIIE